MDNGLAVFLLPPKISTGSRVHPTRELAFLISLPTLFLSAAVILLPQQTIE